MPTDSEINSPPYPPETNPVKEKREKTISIERVENGWIVRPFSTVEWNCGGQVERHTRVWVASTMPELLATVDKVVENPRLEYFVGRNNIPNEPV
jgi:hypothetical protein